MRAIWTGDIAFGLVRIPVRLYPAVRERAIRFTQLHQRDREPLSHKRWCPRHGEVPWEEVVKGFEVREGEYIVLTKDEIERMRPGRTSTIPLTQFADASGIPLLHVGKHYYVTPGEGARAYFLLREALASTRKAAIGTIVLRERERACALLAYGQGLLLVTLTYGYEIRDMRAIGELALPAPEIGKDELALAQELVRQLSVERIDMSRFEDAFARELVQTLSEREQGAEVFVREEPREAASTESLLDTLRASLGRR